MIWTNQPLLTTAEMGMPAQIGERFRQLWHVVGNTPMLEITYRHKKEYRKIHVKCEYLNLTGSLKDRIALYILQKAYETGAIQPGYSIVEASSGNTGISFSALGTALGHAVNIIMPDWLSKERIDIIRSMGATVTLVSREEGGFLGSIAKARQLAEKCSGLYLPNQFENQHNVEAHEKTTARELWMQLQSVDISPDAFVAGVGTGGTIMGVGRYLKKRNANIMIHPLEPLESPTLSTGTRCGFHRIQGISDEFIPAIIDLSKLNDVISVSDGDSILMAQKLAKQLGLAVGISSGANIIGAVQAQNKLGSSAVVVTLLNDSNKKYLSTDLLKEEPVKDEYCTNNVEFIEYKVIGRL